MGEALDGFKQRYATAVRPIKKDLVFDAEGEIRGFENDKAAMIAMRDEFKRLVAEKIEENGALMTRAGNKIVDAYSGDREVKGMKELLKSRSEGVLKRAASFKAAKERLVAQRPWLNRLLADIDKDLGKRSKKSKTYGDIVKLKAKVEGDMEKIDDVAARWAKIDAYDIKVDKLLDHHIAKIDKNLKGSLVAVQRANAKEFTKRKVDDRAVKRELSDARSKYKEYLEVIEERPEKGADAAAKKEFKAKQKEILKFVYENDKLANEYEKAIKFLAEMAGGIDPGERKRIEDAIDKLEAVSADLIRDKPKGRVKV